MADRISTRLQEDLLILLAFNSEKGRIVFNTVSPQLFEGFYSEISARIYQFWDKYGKAPGKGALPTLFDDILEGRDEDKAGLYSDLLKQLYTHKESINEEFTIDRITTFVRQQELKLGVMEAAEILHGGGENALEDAESALQGHMGKRLELFDPGTILTRIDKSLSFLEHTTDCEFPTGVKELDHRGLGPIRKGLYLFIALPKKGKSWFLTNLGKRSILRRMRVCHITLEMSEERVAQRYFQSLFAMAKRKDPVEVTTFELDELNRIIGLDTETIKPKLHLDDPDIRSKLNAKVDQWGVRLEKLVIKGFPSGSLTVKGLEAYLDNLESQHGFVPDLLLVDYADIMSVDVNNLRQSLGRVYVDLRGLAAKRNLALATASQSNREGLSKARISEGNVSEDFSKIATADCVVTYNQTEEEHALGLARLYVSNARNDEDRLTVLINQNYSTGQFVLQSTSMIGDYWEKVKEHVVDE